MKTYAEYIENKAFESANWDLAEYRTLGSKEDIEEGILDLEYLFEQSMKQYSLSMSRKGSNIAFRSNEAEALYSITYATCVMKEMISLKKKLLSI